MYQISKNTFFMIQNFTVNGEALAASQEGPLMTEQFLHDHYILRFNELSGKTEFAEKILGTSAEGTDCGV